MPTPEIEENPQLGPDLVEDDSNETETEEAEVAFGLFICTLFSEIQGLERSRSNSNLREIGAFVFKLCKDKEAKIKSGQKYEADDEQVEKLTRLLENVKTEKEARMEIKEATNAHPYLNETIGLEVEERIKVKDDEKTKLEAKTVEEKSKPRIEDETTTVTTEAEVYMTPKSTGSTESTGSAGSTRSKESKGSKESKESKGSKRSTKFNGYTGSIGSTGTAGSTGSTEAKLEAEENVKLETKNAEMA